MGLFMIERYLAGLTGEALRTAGIRSPPPASPGISDPSSYRVTRDRCASSAPIRGPSSNGPLPSKGRPSNASSPSSSSRSRQVMVETTESRPILQAVRGPSYGKVSKRQRVIVSRAEALALENRTFSASWRAERRPSRSKRVFAEDGSQPWAVPPGPNEACVCTGQGGSVDDSWPGQSPRS